MNEDEIQMPFLQHLAELRKCTVKSLIAVIIGFCICYSFAEPLFSWLTIPFNEAYRSTFSKDPKLVHTGLIEPFMVYIKVGLLGGVFLASPVVFYQFWKFISPGLRKSERRHVVPFVSLATIFFVGGALFGYFGVFPLGFSYFLTVAPADYIEPMIRMQEYYQLASWMLVVFGIVFEGPLIVLYLVALGKIGSDQLIRPWRAILVGISIASALLTPADPGSMILMAAPLTVLYGITIVFALILGKRSKTNPPS